MPSTRLNKNDRERLLAKLQEGHDVESAGAALGLSDDQIRLARDKYGAEIATSFKTGTAKLRARIMETALSDDNSSVLLKLLEQREVQTRDADPITRVERVIIYGSCKNCGSLPGKEIKDKKLSKAHNFA